MFKFLFPILFFFTGTIHGYVLSGEKQPDGTVHVTYDCGELNKQVPYIVSMWNDKIERTQLQPIQATTHTEPISGDGINTISLTSNILGAPWPDGWRGAIIAGKDSRGVITEFDIFINAAFSNSFQEILLHELGHALGLAHSNDQQVFSVMNDTGQWRPSLDDIAGVQSLYGAIQTKSQLLNMSARGLVMHNNPMVAGFIIYGSERKRVAIRALGPSLASLGVTNPLLDPIIALYLNNKLVTFNDNWGGTNYALVSGMNPPHPKESILIMTLDPGAYTAVVYTALVANSGTAVVEIYDLDQ